MDLTTEQQIELLGIMKHWIVATQSDKASDGNYYVVDNKSFQHISLGDSYALVEIIEDLRSHLYQGNFLYFEKLLLEKVQVESGTYIITRSILNMLFDDMIRQVNVRNQRKDQKYKMMYLTFIDFLDKLNKR
jgi:hypothetical protein